MQSFIGSDTEKNLSEYFPFIPERKNAIVYYSIDVYPRSMKAGA